MSRLLLDSCRSDHQPFHELGIPSALFIHSPVEPWYHQPTDTLDKISKEKLQQATEIFDSSVYQIARPETPAFKNSRVAPVTVDYDFEINLPCTDSEFNNGFFQRESGGQLCCLQLPSSFYGLFLSPLVDVKKIKGMATFFYKVLLSSDLKLTH